VKVGVVVLRRHGAVVQAPTTSREDVVAAIDRFQLQRATATGSGHPVRWPTLFPDQGIDLSTSPGSAPPGKARWARTAARKFTPVPPGSYTRPPSSC
jgi:Ca-activated chloride channel family protein